MKVHLKRGKKKYDRLDKINVQHRSSFFTLTRAVRVIIDREKARMRGHFSSRKERERVIKPESVGPSATNHLSFDRACQDKAMLSQWCSTSSSIRSGSGVVTFHWTQRPVEAYVWSSTQSQWREMFIFKTLPDDRRVVSRLDWWVDGQNLRSEPINHGCRSRRSVKRALARGSVRWR